VTVRSRRMPEFEICIASLPSRYSVAGWPPLGRQTAGRRCNNSRWAQAAVKPAGRVFRHAAPRPGFQGLHERGLNDVLDECQPAHAERPGQHGAEPAELVAKKVLHQRARFAHV